MNKIPKFDDYFRQNDPELHAEVWGQLKGAVRGAITAGQIGLNVAGGMSGVAQAANINPPEQAAAFADEAEGIESQKQHNNPTYAANAAKKRPAISPPVAPRPNFTRK